MAFSPIAIVGQGCVLPGALTPAELWSLVHDGRCEVAPAQREEWHLGPDANRALLEKEIASDAGGYVRGFERVFDPSGFAIPADRIRGLDPVFLWSLHAAREALRSAGLPVGSARHAGTVVLGNLSYPTPALVQMALETWEGTASTVDPRNRFMSGLPAPFIAEAVGFTGGGFALDAACASSLYAVKLACDRLHDGAVDIALAGGVNHANDLFLHLGFTALGALSPSGRSRPFNKHADGLVPAQGAAVVALMRLADAEAAGKNILGVIRGVGLSNDGRSRGLLVPAVEGQIRAMRAAYESSGLSPADVSLLECHATGTLIGDAAEIRSVRDVFADNADLPLGSLKSNLGHLITASGAAALIKVTAAMKAGVRPRTISAEELIPDLETGAVRILRKEEPWTSKGPKLAAINNFGFGGNNAHLLVEEWTPAKPQPKSAARAIPSDDIAVIAQAVTAGRAASSAAFGDALLSGTPAGGPAAAFELDLSGLRFPPVDLKESIPQQILLLRTALDLQDVIDGLPRERTSLLIGMECDAEIGRYSLRWSRLGADAGRPTEGAMSAACVLGCMPNVVANRLSNQFDFRSPSFSLSANEASGTIALEIAVRSLREREIDAAVVGAIDLSCEPVHVAATGTSAPGDAAVILVLKRLEDARRDGDPVLAVLTAPKVNAPGLELRVEPGSGDAHVAPLFGHAHAAAGLLHVAAAISACEQRLLPATAGRAGMPWLPEADGRRASVEVAALGGTRTRTSLEADQRSPSRPGDAPSSQTGASLMKTARLAVFSAKTVDELLGALGRRETSQTDGDVRVAIVGSGDEELAARIDRAAGLLRIHTGSRTATLDDGIYFGAGPMAGELGFVFTGPAGAYAGMGRDLALALPELVDSFAARAGGSLRDGAGWVYDQAASYKATPTEKLWGSSYLIQLHAELTRGLLGMKPQASIGYCSGETNALFALGAWSDLDGFRKVIDGSGMYARELAGELQCVRRVWKVPEGEPVGWTSMRVLAPLADVRVALAGEARAHLTIINGAADTIVAGDPAACARFAARIGPVKCRAIEYDFVMHCEEARIYSKEWRTLHHRPTAPVPGVRFYTHGTLSHYAPTADAAADALVGQAMNLVDFPALIERAYADGVRVFVEHGPHAGCTKWIGEALGSREHLAVSLDRYGRSSLLQSVESVARLVAAGAPMDHRALSARLTPKAAAPRPAPSSKRMARFEAHLAPVVFTPVGAEVMAPAPVLPSVRSPQPMVTLTAVATLVPDAAPEYHAAEVASYEAHAGEPVAGNVPALTAHHEQLAALHRTFLRQMAETHARFLGVVFQTGAAPAPVPAAMPLALAAGAPASRVSPAEPAAAPARPPLRIVPPAASVPPAAPVKPAATPAAAATPVRVIAGKKPTGPSFDRAQLEVLASGEISSVFGDLFRQQDGHSRQVRMPMPPLLLADRVTGIEGPPGELGVGTIWTETDVRADSWYLHEGRVPMGILIESGQADLLLISWQGIDFTNKGERVYRLLGCDLILHGELPRAGDTISYEIHIDGHARQGDVRLFFFHYDCRVNGELRMTVRGGQAGFFTDAELAASAGILWKPEEAKPSEGARLDPPAVVCTKDRFSPEEISAFTEGAALRCFGPGFERTETHTRTPAIQPGANAPSSQTGALQMMRLLDEVTAFDPKGGPWKRGYLAAKLALTPDAWFFKGHFKNDPCMPGTLMLEGCVQAMSIYVAALGYTIERDGWRFEPVSEVSYPLRCRGQVTPSSKEVLYEIFVDEVIAGPIPTLYADVLCTVDGLKGFHCRRLGVRLVPAWPLERMALPPADTRPVASVNGFEFGYRSLLSCAWGKPSEAFGEKYRPFDGTRRVARLPGPPYHFMTRIKRVEGEMGGMKLGSEVEVEYDVPPDAWYFDENGARVMPFCVLLEAALQPCGWLASYIGSALTTETDLLFRNLDGTGTVRCEVPDDTGMLTTTAKLKQLSTAGGLIVVGFDVVVRAGDKVVYAFDTVFGFFTAAMMVDQAGLPTSAAEKAALLDASDVRYELDDATQSPPRMFTGSLKLGNRKLLTIDRVSGFWPAGGKAGLGRVRLEKDVDPSDWFFKAHFFQDPVQPGSIGMESMLQALQVLMIEKGMGEGIASPRFEACALDVPLTWKYRGQVGTDAKHVVVDMEVTDAGEDARGRFVVASGSLWVDGKRIYSAKGAGMRIVSGNPLTEGPRVLDPRSLAVPAPVALPLLARSARSIDPDRDTWVKDHRPTFTKPALPMMSVADLVAEAALADAGAGKVVLAVEDLAVSDWLLVDRPRKITSVVTPAEGAPGAVRVVLAADAKDIASAVVRLAEKYPAAPASALPALASPAPLDDPYESGALFHGPAFQVLRRGERGTNGARGTLDAAAGSVPPGTIAPLLLDGALHVVPHDGLEAWSPKLATGFIGFPSRVERLEFFGPAPRTGEVAVDVRCDGPGKSPRHAVLRIELSAAGKIWARMTLVEVLLPKSRLGQASGRDRRAFLGERRPVAGMGISRLEAGVTKLTAAEVREADWLPGTVATVYGIAGAPEIAALAEEVAIRDHVANEQRIHPSSVDVNAARPRLDVRREADGTILVRSLSAPRMLTFDRSATKAFWRLTTGVTGEWVGEDLFFGLLDRFVGGVRFEDPDAFAALRGKSAIYVANHQVAVETLLAALVIGGLTETLAITPAKSAHRDTWVGQLIGRVFSRPGVLDPGLIRFIEREDPNSVLRLRTDLTGELKAGKSVLVHVEGTRGTSARHRVSAISSVFLDLAIETGVPVVPVRFVGGLPVEPAATRLEFPLGYGKQDFWFGRPIAAETLRALPFAERSKRVLTAINELGVVPEKEAPTAPSPDFAAAITAWRNASGAQEGEGAVLCALAYLADASAEGRRLVETVRSRAVPTHDGSAVGIWRAALATWLRGPR